MSFCTQNVTLIDLQISDVIEQLFSGLVPDRVTSFSCNHIIPSSNLLPLIVSKGPRGGDLNYKAARQGDTDVVSNTRDKLAI